MMGARKDIVIVGVCASGKTTLAKNLSKFGIKARVVAQEHSCIPDLFLNKGLPIVIYLHATYEAVRRRGHALMSPYNYAAQLQRLDKARKSADITVDTTNLSPEEVLMTVINKLQEDKQDQAVPDEIGSDIQSSERREDIAIPDELGEEQKPSKIYEGLPIPEEL